MLQLFCFVFKDFIYMRERESKQEHKSKGEGEADSLLSKDPTWDLIPGRWDHDLSQRQPLN